MQNRKRISAPPTPKLWRTRRSNEPDQSWKDPSMPADLDIAFAETVEAIDFDWPESLAVERIQTGIAEMAVAILVFAGFVVLTRGAISVVLRCWRFEVGLGHHAEARSAARLVPSCAAKYSQRCLR